MSIKLSDTAANSQANNIAPLFNGGFIKLYSGSVPADANTALGAQVLLSTLTFGSPAFGSAAAGVITANAITQDSSAAATGTASFYRTYKSDNTTVLTQGTVGTSGADLIMNNVNIQINAVVQMTSFTHTVTE